MGERNMFKNEYIVNEKLYMEQNVKTHAMCWLSAISVLIGLPLVLIGEWFVGVLCLAAAIVLFISYLMMRKNIKDDYIKIANIPTKIKTTFGDMSFKYVNGEERDEISYKSVIRSKNRKNLIVLFLDNGKTVGIKKDSFVEGSLEGFKHFMSIKGF